MQLQNRRLKTTFSGYTRQNLAFATLLMAAFFVGGNAQSSDQKTAVADTTPKSPLAQVVNPEPTAIPVLKDYKEVTIGTTADEVRDILGKAKLDDKDGFYYRFDDDEHAQIRLDESEKVRLIAITYTANHKAPPTFADIFGGEPASSDMKPDGSIYRLSRYPTAGYWVAYSRTGGGKPTVTVTIQKLR